MELIIGAIIVFCLLMGVILIISGCHDHNEANRGTEIGIGISLIIAPIVVTLAYLAWRCVVISCGAEQRWEEKKENHGNGCKHACLRAGTCRKQNTGCEEIRGLLLCQ